MLDKQWPAQYKKMYDRVSYLAKIGVWEYDLVSGHLAWTDTVYDIFGLCRGSPIDRETALRFYEPGSRAKMERMRSEAIRTGGGFTLDIQIRPEAIPARWVRLTALVEKEDGEAVRIFGTKQDITSEKEAYEKVQALQTDLIHVSRASAMGSMASTIAHELNQPLAAISSYLAAARRLATDGGVDPLLEECIVGALDAAQRAGRVIRSARALTAHEGGKQVAMDLEPVLKAAVDLAVARVPNLSVSCKVPVGLRAFADPIQIQQVMMNLLRNVGEAVGDRPCQIGVTATHGDSDIQICVMDDGPGIPEHILPQVFEAFVTTKPEGPGVGLSIARTIVEAHTGQISVSNCPGAGAAVRFTLPLSLSSHQAGTCASANL